MKINRLDRVKIVRLRKSMSENDKILGHSKSLIGKTGIVTGIYSRRKLRLYIIRLDNPNKNQSGPLEFTRNEIQLADN